MNSFKPSKPIKAIPNIKEILNKQLILSKSLTQNEADKLKLTNCNYESEEDNFLPKQWFCSLDIGEWEEVEIFVQGNTENPSEEFIELAGEIFSQLPQHINRALNYLKIFFPAHEIEDYYLATISFGRIINFDDHLFSGFTVAFYSERPHEFQYKVKLKKDGWPIGFEGGPL